MHIVSVNQFIGGINYAPPYRTNFLSTEWAKAGHDVTVISASYSHLFHHHPIFNGFVHEEMNNGVRFIYLKTPTYKGNGIGRVINLLVFSILLLVFSRRFSISLRPDIIISASVYPIEMWPIYRIARISKCPIIREVRDLWPLTLIELGGLSNWHPFVILIGLAERFSYGKAKNIVTTLSHSKNYMTLNGLRSEQWCFIPQGYEFEEKNDEDAVIPEPHKNIISDLRRKNKFIIAYCGSHGIANALQYLISTAVLLKGKNVAFVLIGQGPEKDNLRRFASESDASNVVFLPAVPKRTIYSILRTIDACYHGTKNSAIYKYGISPNKLMDYMASAKPIINAVNTSGDIVLDADCGVSIKPEDPELIAGAIEEIMQMTSDERAAMGERGREYLLKHHDYKILAKKYIDVLFQ